MNALGRGKPAGFILDFVGIFEHLEKALAFDSEDVQGVVEGIEALKERFADLMAKGRDAYLPLVAGKGPDKAAEAVLEHFRDKEARQEFYRYFRELQEVYEILSPDAFLRPFLADYEELAGIFRMLRANYEAGVQVDRDFLRKTARLVQEHTETGAIQPPAAPYRLDAVTLAKIAGEDVPDTVKVFNLLQALRVLVAEEVGRSPYLIPIGERAEEIARRFEERQATTEETLRQLQLLAEECVEAEKAKKERALSPEGFAVFWLLQREGIGEAEAVARKVAEAFQQYPHWERSDTQQRNLRIALFRVLLSAGVDPVVGFAERIMKMLRGRAA